MQFVTFKSPISFLQYHVGSGGDGGGQGGGGGGGTVGIALNKYSGGLGESSNGGVSFQRLDNEILHLLPWRATMRMPKENW